MSSATCEAAPKEIFALSGEGPRKERIVFFEAQEEQQPIFDLIFKNPVLDHVMSILIGGALGGGKTKAAVGAVIGMALFFPGSRIYVCRKDFLDLRDTIYKDFAEICPPSLIARPKGNLLERVEAAHDVLLTNKSLIMFRELKDLSGKFGLEVNMVVIEQIEEIQENIFNAIFSRLRPWMNAPANSPYVLLGASNPCNTWVKKTWIDQKLPYHWYIHLSPRKNKGLLKVRPNYLKDLEVRFDASWVKKYIDGDWNAAVEGAIYSEFDQALHVVQPFRIPSSWSRYMALDPHLAKPFYALYAAQAPGGALFFYHEHLGKQFQKSADYFKEILEFESDLAKLPTRIIDYSLAGVLHEKNDGKTLWKVIEENDMVFQNAKKANKKKAILNIKEELSKNPPFVYFFSSCTNTIAQIGNYRVNDSEVLIKQEDHLVDCFHYIMAERPWIKPGEIISWTKSTSYLSNNRSLKLA